MVPPVGEGVGAGAACWTLEVSGASSPSAAMEERPRKAPATIAVAVARTMERFIFLPFLDVVPVGAAGLVSQTLALRTAPSQAFSMSAIGPAASGHDGLSAAAVTPRAST